jgi:Ca-activated chloride channel family protein
MKIDANDPRWTAYALGEIEDEQERAEIESILEVSPEMRRLVEEIRSTGNVLSQELKAEPAVDLTSAQRMRIAEKANSGRTWFGLRPVWVLATAAALVLVSVITIRQMKQIQKTPQQIQVAQVMPEQKAPAPIQTQVTQPAPAVQPAAGTAKTLRTVPNKTAVPDTDQAKSEESRKPEVLAPATLAAVANQNQITTSVQDALLESSSTTGQVMQEKTITLLPPVNTDMTDVINVMGGVVRSDADSVFGNTNQTFGGAASNNVNVQRDGISVNDVRFAQSGIVSPGRLDPEMVSEFKLVLTPVSPPPCCGRPPLLPVQRMPGKFNTEAYDHILDNPFLDVVQNPLSTFSIDVDTASYSNMRRFLDGGNLPPKDSIRIEELVNYFDYDYKGPKDEKPFAVNFELTEAPWAPEHRLLRIGLKGREINQARRPDGNLVFLLDVSGSMADWNKLPLIKESMRALVDRLTEADRISIVVYASDADVLLPYARGDQKEKIMQAIDRLHAGGSTNGGAGIQLAYRTAQENFIKGGTNRIILATDGDFNVGITNRGDLARLIEEKAKTGIYLSALGFGMDNYKDATLEMLANKGHGNYAYIDTLNEAKKVLMEQIDSTLVAIAKDVKIQVEFNPRIVSSYRLIGYEDRVMAKEDFNDDAKDAGVIGAGHAVTALYELVPAGTSVPNPGVDPLKYQKPLKPSSSAESNELVTVKIRNKEPEKDKSVLSEFTVKESKEKFIGASKDFKFAAAVAAFGMVLRDSPYKGTANLERALEWAQDGKGEDLHGYRQEFIRLIHRAISLSF